MSKATMHLDGCHFFAWVFENPQGEYELTWYERSGDDLYVHMDTDDCDRCTALYNGAKTREASATIELPDDAKMAFLTVVAKIGEFDSGAENSQGSPE